MRMNKTLAYGLACLHYLDEHRADKWSRVSDIAKFQNLPVAYCNKVLQALIHAGFVYSQKGKGYGLRKKLENINVWNLMEAFTFNHAPTPEKKGVSNKLYDTLREEVNHWLIGLSVADIIEIMRAEEERKKEEKK